MKSRIILLLLFLTSVVGLSLTMAAAPPVAAAPMTYVVTSTSCTGPGSITEAMASANANPGEDTIQVVPGLQIEAGECLPGFKGWGGDYFIVNATESVIIEGNGAKLVGHMVWFSSGGLDTPLDKCPSDDPNTLLGAITPGFIKVGLFEQNNEDITVTVRNLDMQELNSVARIEKNASLILEDLSMYRIISAYRNCNDTAVTAAEGANFTARRTRWESIWHLKQVRIIAFGYAAAISSYSLELAGDLTIEDSYFSQVFRAGTINWWGKPGSVVNIVTSRFDDANGFIIQASAKTNIVNTIWSELPFSGGEIETRLANASTEPMNIVASTFLYAHTGCDSDCQFYGSQGRIYRLPGAAKINLVQSAIGVNFPDLGPGFVHEKLLDPNSVDPPYGFSADEYTWVQPTAGQDADALKIDTNQLNLLTDPSAFRQAGPGTTQAEWATPLDSGELIDRVPDAACGKANQLLNPIDNTCITVDALGNPRVDANGKRNIGAVQLTLAPHLTVSSTGDTTVDLAWTRPQDPDPTKPVTGYKIFSRLSGSLDPFTETTISGANTLSTTIGSLVNGTEYEFKMVSVNSDGDIPVESNLVTATPLGPIGTPVVTATPGNEQVDLSWTLPSDGGHVIDAYSILWRPAGTISWIGAAGTFGTDSNPPATQTTITGLTNGIEYEFAVTANASAVVGPQGLATATPVAPGTIVISKLTTPAGGTGFSFTQDVDNSGDFTLDDQGSKRFNAVAPGTYTTTEADPQGLGYELTNISCVDGDTNGVASTGDVAARTATINVDSGETVQCTFYNAEEETVVIEKRTIPPGGSGFTFSDDIGTPNSFTLEDAQTRTFTNVLPGDYQVTEGTMSGYELTAIDCTVEGVPVPGDLDTRTATFTLQQPGGSAHCTFTNSKLGTIIMRKETLPDGALDAFGYTISGPDTNDSGFLTDGGSTQIDNAKSGTWALTESLPAADWHLGDISCTSTLGTSTFTKDINNLKATVELAPGDTMDCTFTNVEDETITVEKVTVPAGDTTTSFAFSGSGSIGDFALKDGESQSFSVDAEAGPYILTEDDPSGAGYEVTEIRCVNTLTGEISLGDLDTRSVALNTQPGESQHCTFTNERHGQVVIRKATAPAGDTTNSFGFYGSFPSFSLKDGQNQTFLDVAPGTYSVSELDPSSLDPEYGLKGIRCTDSDPNGTPSSSNLETHTASINLDAGETVDCTFINSEPDTVSIRKSTFPAGGTGFGFDGSFGQFTLDDGQLKSFEVSSGSYTISEDDPTPGYDLILAFCYDASTGEFYEGDLEKRQLDLLDLEAGHQILCDFVNAQRGTIIIEKAPGAGTGYAFSGDLGDFSLDSGQEKEFVNQPVGQYLVSEQTPPGDTLTGLTCTDDDANGVPSTGDVAANTATINLDPGETVRCAFTNQPGGSIVIKKTVDSGPNGPFTFLDNIVTPATFELSGGEEQRFDGVLPGTYTVQETGVPNGSGLAQITCVDSDGSGTPSGSDLSAATAVIHLDPGETVECTFTNREPEVRITESFQVSRVEEGKLSGEGSKACYWVTLATVPISGNVVVNVGPPQNNQVGLNKASVTLNNSNWNNLSTALRSNFVCIRAIDDHVADGGAEVCRDGNSDMLGGGSVIPNKECGDHQDFIPHSVASSTVPGLDTNTPIVRMAPDGAFTEPATIPALVRNNDTVGVQLTESYAVTDLDEDGSPVQKACYWVNLTSQPTAPVNVQMASNTVNLNKTEVTLNASNWNTLKAGVTSNQVCVSPIDNNVIEPDGNFCAPKNSHIFGTGANAGQVCGDYLGQVSHSVSSAGDAAYDGTTNIKSNGPNFDGNKRTVDVLIRNDDTAALHVIPGSLNILEGETASYDLALTAQPGAAVTVNNGEQQTTFTGATWDQPQRFTVAIANDDVAEGPRQDAIAHTVTSSDANFKNLDSPPLPLTVVDDDTAGVMLSTAEVQLAEGGSTSYTLRLTSRPGSTVTVRLEADGQGEVSPATVTFTSANWNDAQSVQVTAVDDQRAEGPEHQGVIAHVVSSSDAGYDGLAVSDLDLRIADNDDAIVLLSQASDLSVAEGGATAVYEVRLNSEPAVPVTVALNGGDQLRTTPASLVFTTDNWDEAQGVTVRAVDDAIAEGGEHEGTLGHSVTSSDTFYDGSVIDDLSVTIGDNDMVGVQVNPKRLYLESGEQGSYSIRLTSQPRGEVVVYIEPQQAIAVDADLCDEEGGKCLRFTPQNWNVVQVVTVSMEAESAATGTIKHSVVSDDALYENVYAASVRIGPFSGDLFLPVIRR